MEGYAAVSHNDHTSFMTSTTEQKSYFLRNVFKKFSKMGL